MLIALLYYFQSGFIENGTDNFLLAYLLFPAALPIMLGTMSGSGVAILIFLIISFLLLWIIVLVILKLIKFAGSKIVN